MSIIRLFFLFFSIFSSTAIFSAYFRSEEEKVGYFIENVNELQNNLTVYIELLFDHENIMVKGENFIKELGLPPTTVLRDPIVKLAFRRKIFTVLYESLSESIPYTLRKEEAEAGVEKYFPDSGRSFSFINVADDPLRRWYFTAVLAKLPNGASHSNWHEEDGVSYNGTFFITEIAGPLWNLRYLLLSLANPDHKRDSRRSMVKLLEQENVFPAVYLSPEDREDRLGHCYLIQEGDELARDSEAQLIEPIPEFENRASLVVAIERTCFNKRLSSRNPEQSIPRFIHNLRDQIETERGPFVKKRNKFVTFSAKRGLFVETIPNLFSFRESDMEESFKFKFFDANDMEEVGIDASGLTKEFFTIAGTEMIEKGIFIKIGNRFQPNPEFTNFPIYAVNGTRITITADHFYQNIGELFGYAFMYGQNIPMPLATPILDRMWGVKKFTLIDLLSSYLQDDREGVRKLLSIIQNDLDEFHGITSLDEGDWFFAKPYPYILSQIRREYQLPYIQQEGDAEVVDPKGNQRVEALLRGFFRQVPLGFIQKMNRDHGLLFADFSTLLTGSAVSAKELSAVIELGGAAITEQNRQQVSWLKEIVIEQSLPNSVWAQQNPEMDFATAFLRFSTGGSIIPIKIKLIIDNIMNRQSLPQSHTCFNSIDTPLYDSKEAFLTKLIRGMRESSGMDRF